MTTLTIRRLDTAPPIVITDAELIALGYFLLDPASGPKGIDPFAGGEPTDRITRKDLERINSTFVARSPESAWAGVIGPDGLGRRLDWLADLQTGWDLIAMEDTAWSDAGASKAIEKALHAIDGPYIRRAVATKMLHLKRPALIPVLDSFVVRQLDGPVNDRVDDTMLLIDEIRSEGRANLRALQEIRAFLEQRGLDRTLVRILDALLWSRDPDSWLTNLPRFVRDIQAQHHDAARTPSGSR